MQTATKCGRFTAPDTWEGERPKNGTLSAWDAVRLTNGMPYLTVEMRCIESFTRLRLSAAPSHGRMLS
jgi:hypothetical protein